MSIRWLKAMSLMALVLALLVGCSDAPPATKNKVAPEPVSAADQEIRTTLAKLSPEDRKLAEEQKLCPVQGEPLGSMGVPPKLTIKGQTVFICCASCKKEAEANPDKTLKAVADAKGNSPSR